MKNYEIKKKRTIIKREKKNNTFSKNSTLTILLTTIAHPDIKQQGRNKKSEIKIKKNQLK